jgi:uncharacterized protein YdhG (YjbR/CyaY superfamily)
MSADLPELFADPPNFEAILASLKKASSTEELQLTILTTFPGWITMVMDSYSPDYNYMQKNWNHIAVLLKTYPKKILVVKHLQVSPRHRLINMFAELMTNAGYCVRQMSELGACPVCFRAIPSEALWIRLKQNNMPVPSEWSDMCKGCK